MMGDSHRQLLLELKTVVEGLLSSQVANVWNVYGGLSRLHSVFEKILKNGCKLLNHNGVEDIWVFIEGLEWLEPSLATSPTPVCPNSPPPHPHTDKAMIWLHNSLETHSLSEKLSCLVSDNQHMALCYSSEAFLRQRNYVDAALLCLQAIEQNRLTLLADIHPMLYLPEKNLKVQMMFHRRCSSYPETLNRVQYIETQGVDVRETAEMWSAPVVHSDVHEPMDSTNDPPSSAESAASVLESKVEESSATKRRFNYGAVMTIKSWKSLPSLTRESDALDLASFRRSYGTQPSSPVKFVRATHNLVPSNALKIDYSSSSSKTLSLSKSKRKEKQLKRAAVNFSSGESIETVMNCGARAYNRPDRRKKKSFIEDDGAAPIRPMSTGPSYFPVPAAGQTLTSFLACSLTSARAPAELDRENAHFSVSEAIIAALEQVKCNRWERLIDEVVEDSDEEIQELKQRIRLRRRMKLEERKKIFGLSLAFWPNTPSDNTTTDQSFSPRSTESDTGTDDSLSTDGVDDIEVDQVTPTNFADIVNNSGLSLSLASLYSEADLGNTRRPVSPLNTSTSTVHPFISCTASTPSVLIPKRPSSPTVSPSVALPDQDNSAELVALSLLARFSERQLPKANEVQWLVSEKDAPQQLLPLPDSYPVEELDLRDATPLRGTSHWAPPRPQIIFTLHPPPQRRILLLKQDLRCAGCGMKVAPEYSHRFRYCEYLARYFCTGCHSNKQSIIPGRVLAKWDFNKYPVSNFSLNLLEQIAFDPLFSVSDVNPQLYKRVRIMDKLRITRLQLYYVKDFIITCKFAKNLKAEIDKEAPYVLMDVDMYSLQDLIQAKSGDLLRRLSRLATDSINHVAICELCQARGFVCELCTCPDVIFPWQLTKVTRCYSCGSCQHTACLQRNTSLTCPKCTRLRARK